MSLASLLIDPISRTIDNIVDRVAPDQNLKQQLKAEISAGLRDLERTELQGRINVILAEARGESWIQRSWRPVLMLTIVAIVANNYLLAPYLTLFGLPAQTLDLPEHLYTLMTIGVGGYVAGRSAEKVAKTWKEKE